MASKKKEATEPQEQADTNDISDRIDLNDPHMSGREAVERALGYRKDEPKAE